MVAEGWNHNTHYHDRLLRAVPRPCPRALDVGCGLGGFARRLASEAHHVDAIDRDPDVIRRARELSPAAANVRFAEADFLEWRGDEPYDFVSMVATLHHLPFGDAVRHGAALLRPGGVLGVIGLDRARSLAHMCIRGAVAYPTSRFYRLTRRTAEVGAPIREPEMTLETIRRDAAALLPGAVIRRHVLWRYSLVWIKPIRER